MYWSPWNLFEYFLSRERYAMVHEEHQRPMMISSLLECRLSLIGYSQWLPHGHGTPYHNTFGTRPLFPSSAENWRPFCSARRSLTLCDNVLCFICSPVIRCWSVTMYWLLQTDFVDTVRWSCSSSVIVPPKSYSLLLLLLLLLVMVALWNRANHYIFILWFLLSFFLSFFFPFLA